MNTDGACRVAFAARTCFQDPSIRAQHVFYTLRRSLTCEAGWYWRDSRTGSVLRIGASIAACERRARGCAVQWPDYLPISKPCARGCTQGMVLEIDPHEIGTVPSARYRCQDCDDREELNP